MGPNDLMTIPKVNRAIAKNKVHPIPSLLVTKGVKVEIIPKAIKGRVVKRPQSPLERPVDA